MAKPFSGLTRNAVLLSLASLFSDISTEMLYPVLPVFLTQTLHAGGSIVGLVEGLAQAVQNIVQGFSGTLADKLQRRKTVALAGYFLSAISKPLIGLSSAWQGVLGARFLDRMGAGGRTAPRDALIAASVDAADRGKAFGLEGAGDNTGAFVGPLLTVVLLMLLHLNIRLIFYLAIIPGLIAFFLILLVKERRVRIEPTTRIDVSLRRFPNAYWKYLAASGLFALGNSSNAFLLLQTQAIGVSLQTTILIYAAFNLVAALISYPAGYLSDRLGRRNVLLGGFLIFLVTYLGFALSRNVVVVAALFAGYGLYQGIFRAVGKALAADLVPEGLRAGGVGWYSTTLGLAGLAASLAAGFLWDRAGHAAVFFYGVAFAVAGSAALLMLEQISSGLNRMGIPLVSEQ